MTKDTVTVYERDFNIAVDPASPDGDTCVKVYWYLNKNGDPEILKYEKLTR